jgi:hypothetical protein
MLDGLGYLIGIAHRLSLKIRQFEKVHFCIQRNRFPETRPKEKVVCLGTHLYLHAFYDMSRNQYALAYS